MGNGNVQVLIAVGRHGTATATLVVATGTGRRASIVAFIPGSLVWQLNQHFFKGRLMASAPHRSTRDEMQLAFEKNGVWRTFISIPIRSLVIHSGSRHGAQAKTKI